jgi:hypothetical protein
VVGCSLEERGSAFHVRSWGVGEVSLVLLIMMSFKYFMKRMHSLLFLSGGWGRAGREMKLVYLFACLIT